MIEKSSFQGTLSQVPNKKEDALEMHKQNYWLIV